MSDHLHDSKARCEQLELFPGLEHPLTLDDVKARLPHGWWRGVIGATLRALADSIIVSRCEERAGELLLEATNRDGTSDGLTVILARLRARAPKICGCCGAESDQLPEPPHFRSWRACPRCEHRLRAGESCVQIAGGNAPTDTAAIRSIMTTTHRTAAQRSTPHAGTSALRPIAQLGPAEFREVYRQIRAALREDVVGHDRVVAALSLVAARHVGSLDVPGARVLIIGPSGVGKGATIDALRRALASYGLAWVHSECASLTSPGWSGAATLPGLIEQAVTGYAPDDIRARKLVIVLDEIHFARQHPGATSNMAAHDEERLASLMAAAGGGIVTLPDSQRGWSSREALVIAMGAFTDLLTIRATRPPSAAALAAAGIHLELATRLTETVLVMEPLSEADLVRVLKGWRALIAVQEQCERLGYTVRILEETFRRAARAVVLGHQRETARSAGGWLVSALQDALVRALDDDSVRELIITPDDLPIASDIMRDLRGTRGDDVDDDDRGPSMAR